MSGFDTVITAVLPVFVVVLTGLTLRMVNWLSEEADQSLIRLTVNILQPALILDSVLKNDALKQAANVVMPPALGFGLCATGMMVAFLLARTLGLKSRESAGTFGLCAGLQNYGYVPIPLIMALFDQETLGVLFVHNLGVDTAMWTVGLMMLRPPGQGAAWKRLLSAPVLAIVTGVILNAAGAYHFIPKFILDTIHMVGQCALPMGLILVGATMADQLKGFQSRKGFGVMAGACTVRLGLLPLLFLVVAKYAPLSVELKRVLVVQAAMPSAIFPVVMAKHFGGDQGTAIRVVAATAIVSLVTIPFWLKFGLEWVGGN
jgi:malate permease and related proteins